MATPPGGPSSYGSGHEPSQDAPSPAAHGDTPFLNRFNFPSAPSDRVQQDGSGPYDPQAGYDQPAGYDSQAPVPGQQAPYAPSAQPGPQSPQPAPQQQFPPRQPGRPGQPAAPAHGGGPAPQGRPGYEGRPGPHDGQVQPPHTRIQPVQPGTRDDGAARRGDQAPGQPQQPLVRPYAMTGGRTRPRYQLAIEALVHTTAEPARLQGQLPEHQRICRLCYEIKSVAEISALLTIPLGVARILVADLAEAGLVAIHQPGGGESSADGQPDVTLLERVLSGLRKL
ncbi:DUF742 domain-containing protein [Streptomyces cacaoi]